MPRPAARAMTAGLAAIVVLMSTLVATPAAALVDPDGNPVVVDDGLHDHGASDRLLEPSSVRAAAAAAAKAPKAKKRLKTLVIPVFWSGAGKDTTNKKVKKRAKAAMKRADAFFRTVSRGRIGHRTTALGWQKIPRPTTQCGIESQAAHVARHGSERARRAGKNPNRYDRVIFYVTGSACNGSSVQALGLGSMPGRYVWLDGTWAPNVVIHELGHNLGLGHADYATCSAKNGKRVIFGAAKRCRNAEYGDMSDHMGNNPHAGWFSAPKLARLGWFTKKNLARNNSGKKKTYTLHPMSAQTKKRKAVRVKGTKGRFYWVEYRRATGLDRGLAPGLQGVQVRIAKPSSRTAASQVLDMLPAPQNDGRDLHAVTLGKRASWTSPEGIKFTVRKAGKKAKVVVQRKTRKARKPLAPTPRVAATDLGANVSWTYPKDRGTPVQSFTVRVRSSDGQTQTHRVSQLDGRHLRATLGNLDPGLDYTVAVRSTNHRGGSAWSSSVALKPLDLRPTVTVHSPASGATLRADSSVTVDLTPALPSASQGNLHALEVCFIAAQDRTRCYSDEWRSVSYDIAPGRRTSATISTLHLRGAQEIRVTVWDSLGRTATRTIPVTVTLTR